MPYVTLDDASVLEAATHDAERWLSGFPGPLAIDEIQKAPSLLPAIKARIDRDRKAGRYVLTGSSNVLTLPRVSESLAGRVEVLPLWPLAQIEMAGSEAPSALLQSAFSARLELPRQRVATAHRWRRRAIVGGYPEAVTRPRSVRRAAWFESYISTVLARDVRDVADISGVTTLPRILRLVASRSGATLNLADLARSVEVPQTTMRRYLALLEAIFLVHSVPPWHANLGKRLVKAPKLYLSDSGMLAHLLGIDATDGAGTHDGTLYETFGVFEIIKQCSVLDRPPQVFHFRSHDGHEVDLVIEDHKGRVVGVEFKASQSPSSHDARGLRWLRDALGHRFVRGLLLHGGKEVVPFDHQITALPLESLFEPPR
jgi:predicted AAA+ superfamily ATPase